MEERFILAIEIALQSAIFVNCSDKNTNEQKSEAIVSSFHEVEEGLKNMAKTNLVLAVDGASYAGEHWITQFSDSKEFEYKMESFVFDREKELRAKHPLCLVSAALSLGGNLNGWYMDDIIRIIFENVEKIIPEDHSLDSTAFSFMLSNSSGTEYAERAKEMQHTFHRRCCAAEDARSRNQRLGRGASGSAPAFG